MLATTSQQLQEIHNRVSKASSIGFDTESSGPLLKFLKGQKKMINVYQSSLTGFSVAFDDGVSFYVPLRHRQGNAPIQHGLDLLRFILSDGHAADVCAHHWKHELLVARLEGIAVSCKMRDSELESWLSCRPSADPKHPYALKALALTHLALKMGSFEQTVGQGHSFCDISPANGAGYAEEDAIAALGLCTKLGPTVAEYGLWNHYTTIEIPFVRVLRHMEDTGVLVSPSKVESIQRDLTPRVAQVRDEFLWLVGLDIASPKAASYLYKSGEWSTEDIERTKTGFKSDKTAVKMHLARCKPGSLGFEAARMKQEFQTLNKILSTYTWKMLEVAQQYPDGRIHSNYHHTGTRTGRLSSSYINMQQIPVRTELGKRVADAFVAPEGWSFVAADESQFEIRMLAHLLGRGRFYEAFKADPRTDPHMQTAAASGASRQDSKVLLLAIIYRARAKKLAKTLGCTVERAQELLDKLMANMPEVPETQDKIIAAARRRGYVRTYSGRRRYVPNIALKPTRENLPLIWADERIACNTPIQGGARDVMTVAMVKFFEELTKTNSLNAIKIGGQIHDDLRLEVSDDAIEPAKKALQFHLQNAALRVPLLAEPHVGKTWMELK